MFGKVLQRMTCVQPYALHMFAKRLSNGSECPGWGWSKDRLVGHVGPKRYRLPNVNPVYGVYEVKHYKVLLVVCFVWMVRQSCPTLESMLLALALLGCP